VELLEHQQSQLLNTGQQKLSWRRAPEMALPVSCFSKK